MKLICVDIPDTHEARARWLEQHLIGVQLRELVSELSAVHSARKTSMTLDTLLAGARNHVLNFGLRPLPKDRIQALLRNPALLYELQDLVMIEGGAYWQNLTPDAKLTQRVERSLPIIKKLVVNNSKIVRPNWSRRLVFAGSALAAMLLVALLLVNPWQNRNWGLNKSDVFASNVTHGEYTARLSKAAGEWFDQEPQDRVALAERIADFKRGCEKLLVVEHTPLSSSERAELLKRCKVWIAQLDHLNTDLNAGRNVAEVRADASQIVRKLQGFLAQQG